MVRDFVLRVLVPAAAMLAIAGCDESADNKRAQQAAVALGDYYRDAWRPPSSEWSVAQVRLGKDSGVTIDAAVASEALTKTIMERSRFEQMEIARMACPPVADKVWNQVAKKQSVGVALSGAAGHIINAQCKRP